MFVDSAPKTDDENTESRDVIPASRFMAPRFTGVGRLYFLVLQGNYTKSGRLD